MVIRAGRTGKQQAAAPTFKQQQRQQRDLADKVADADVLHLIELTQMNQSAT
jgi:hypothetical protein